jgi:hypothetical protein
MKKTQDKTVIMMRRGRGFTKVKQCIKITGKGSEIQPEILYGFNSLAALYRL